jgi:enediyne biosynthesis protein E11
VTVQRDVISDLTAEGEQVERLLADLDADQWTTPTPAEGWTVAHQVAHLVANFKLAALSASDPDQFNAVLSRLGTDFDANVYAALSPYLAAPPDVLLSHFRDGRAAAEKALGALPGEHMVPWLARPLPARVLAAAGIMELFAHGQDIADAVGVTPERTDRIWHLVTFAVRVWDFGYLARGLTPPEVEFRYELTAPSGTPWTLGPANSPQRITGPAEDFCLLVTRRRHRDDLRVTAQGAEADAWLDIAQAYRGTPGSGRKPGQFAALQR